MQASEPISVKVKRRGSLPNTTGEVEVSSKATAAASNSASSSIPKQSQSESTNPEPEKGAPQSVVCFSCGRSQTPQISVAIQTDDVIFMPPSPSTSIWFNEDEPPDTERRYSFLISFFKNQFCFL